MSVDSDFGNKVRQALDQGTQDIGLPTAKRLQAARQEALRHQRASATGFQLAGAGHLLTDALLGHGRLIVATVALALGASGTYVWHLYEQAVENAEIDSALLADELPPAAYLDRGFRAWLERSSQSLQ